MSTYRNESEWITDINVNPRTIKLTVNISSNNFALGEDCLQMTPKE